MNTTRDGKFWVKKWLAILAGSSITLLAGLTASYEFGLGWTMILVVHLVAAEIVVQKKPKNGSIEDAMVKTSVVFGLLGVVVGLVARYGF